MVLRLFYQILWPKIQNWMKSTFAAVVFNPPWYSMNNLPLFELYLFFLPFCQAKNDLSLFAIFTGLHVSHLRSSCLIVGDILFTFSSTRFISSIFLFVFFMCVCDQTDLCGIRWRKFAFIEPVHEPLNDPILRSYSRCLRENILCVWRRVANKSSIDAFQTGIYEPRPPNSVTHPPLSLRTAKELWIFWYGDEPNLHELLVPELLRASGEWSFQNYLFAFNKKKCVCVWAVITPTKTMFSVYSHCFDWFVRIILSRIVRISGNSRRMLWEWNHLWMSISIVQSVAQSYWTVINGFLWINRFVNRIDRTHRTFSFFFFVLPL